MESADGRGPRRAAVDDSLRAPLSADRHTILIVDDDAAIREAFAALLQANAFEVATASDGADALGQLRAGLRPCVVLLDLRMPGVDGWEVWKQVRSDPALADIRVVVVTADLVPAHQAREMPVGDVLLKPVKPEDLIAAVERHCRRQLRVAPC